MQVGAEAVALGSNLDLPRDLLFDTLAKTDVVGGSRFSSVMARCAPPGECGRKSTPFRPSKLLPLSILYSGVSRGLSCGVFSSPIQEPGANRGGRRGLIQQGP